MIWILFIALEIARNYVLIETLKIRPHYGYSALIRFAFGAIFLFKAHPEFDPLGDVTTIFPAVTYAAFLWSSFYISFDLILNLLRKKPILYRGKKSGFLDPLFIKLGLPFYILFKLFTLIILIISIYAVFGEGFRGVFR